MATDTAFYIGRQATTRIGWPPNTAPAMVALRLRHPQHHPLCGWQKQMATTYCHPFWREILRMTATHGNDRMASFPLQYKGIHNLFAVYVSLL